MRKTYDYDLLQAAVTSYFDACDAVNTDTKIRRPYTLSGLIYALGFDREEFDALCAKKKYRALFSHAKARVEAFIEEHTLTGALSPTASANTLKYHFGWGADRADEPLGTVKIMMDKELSRLAE